MSVSGFWLVMKKGEGGMVVIHILWQKKYHFQLIVTNIY